LWKVSLNFPNPNDELVSPIFALDSTGCSCTDRV